MEWCGVVELLPNRFVNLFPVTCGAEPLPLPRPWMVTLTLKEPMIPLQSLSTPYSPKKKYQQNPTTSINEAHKTFCCHNKVVENLRCQSRATVFPRSLEEGIDARWPPTPTWALMASRPGLRRARDLIKRPLALMFKKGTQGRDRTFFVQPPSTISFHQGTHIAGSSDYRDESRLSVPGCKEYG